jgi:hypothetical protein
LTELELLALLALPNNHFSRFSGSDFSGRLAFFEANSSYDWRWNPRKNDGVLTVKKWGWMNPGQ